MSIEQKIESYNLFAGVDHQKIIDNRLVLGWEVVSSSVNNAFEGQKLIVTYRRNKDMKYYEQLKDIDDQVIEKELKIVELLRNDTLKFEKYLRRLPFYGALSVIMLFGLILLDIPIIIGLFTTDIWDVSTILTTTIIIAIVASGHYLQYRWNRNIKRKIKDDSVNAEVNKIKDQIGILIEEAKSITDS